MPETPSSSIMNRDLSDATYMEEIVRQNEALLLEVEHLRYVVREKGFDQLKQLRDENSDLRQKLVVLESNLKEKSHQLEVLESAYNQFDGVQSALRELSEQRKLLSDAQEQCETLGEQNSALKMELLKKHQSEEHMQQLLEQRERECHVKEDEVAELRISLENAMSKIAMLEEEKCSMEKELRDATAAVLEARDRSRELEKKHAILNEKASLVEFEAKEACGATNKRMQDIQSAYAQEEVLRRAAEEQREQLRVELCAAKKTAALKEEELEKIRAQYQIELNSVNEKEVSKLKTALEKKEEALKSQVDKTAAAMAEMELLKEEKNAMVQRYGLVPEEVERLKSRLEKLSEERSKGGELQRRFEAMLLNSATTNSDIKHLFETMLDYQERRDEEMQTRLLIQKIQAADSKKVYEANIKKLYHENKILSNEIRSMRGNSTGTEDARHINHNRNSAAETEMPAIPSVTPQGNSPSTDQKRDEARKNGVADADPWSSTVLDDLWGESVPRLHEPQLSVHPQNQDEQDPTTARSKKPRSCPRCTLLNDAEAILCNLCGAPF